ncbi:MAG: nucleotide exchange factor GrpE [Bacteroidales bacterium]|nr:nucleotide exchange factor GrpE [Bacteroidales bacterium]MDD3859540.1 nucleotide exchange factor GrpE [Bacteroidales bacterium]
MDKDLINSPEQDVNDGAEVNQEQNKEKNKSKKSSRTILKSKEKKLQEEIDLLNQKNEELKDKYLRLIAEYDNFRKRTIKEKIDLRETVKIDIIKDFLPVVDDIERAMMYLNEVKDVEATVEGIRLISQKFLDFIKMQGVEEIISKDQDFNTDFHEAITKFQVEEEDKKGKVIDVVQKGYKINDKIIRFSKVVVGE